MIVKVLFMSLVVWHSSLVAAGQLPLASDGVQPAPKAERYVYRFENSEFLVSRIDIEFDDEGKGKMSYRKKDADDPEETDLRLLPETVSRLQKLLAQLDFVNSPDTFQTSLEHPNLGATTIEIRQGDRKRTLTYNYTPNIPLQQIANLFRGLMVQHDRVSKLQISRRFQPLDTPKQLSDLENELKSGRIAEPTALISLLKDLSDDGNLPLIARNHAKKLAERIEKK